MLNCFAKDATSAEAEAARGGVRAPARREDGARWEAGRVVGVAAGRAARAGLEKRGWVEGGGEREGSVSVIFFLCPPRVPPVLSRARRHPGWTVGSTRPCAQRGDGIPRQVRAAGACAGEATPHDDDAGHENVCGCISVPPLHASHSLHSPEDSPARHGDGAHQAGRQGGLHFRCVCLFVAAFEDKKNRESAHALSQHTVALLRLRSLFFTAYGRRPHQATPPRAPGELWVSLRLPPHRTPGEPGPVCEPAGQKSWVARPKKKKNRHHSRSLTFLYSSPSPHATQALAGVTVGAIALTSLSPAGGSGNSSRPPSSSADDAAAVERALAAATAPEHTTARLWGLKKPAESSSSPPRD
jgi:hypothetical protein